MNSPWTGPRLSISDRSIICQPPVRKSLPIQIDRVFGPNEVRNRLGWGRRRCRTRASLTGAVLKGCRTEQCLLPAVPLHRQAEVQPQLHLVPAEFRRPNSERSAARDIIGQIPLCLNELRPQASRRSRGRVPSRAEMEQHLATVLASPQFKGSQRCGEFLRFVVDRCWAGGKDGLHERAIAVDLLGKAPGAYSSDDANVRVIANEVRKRLAKFYETAGVGGTVRLELPLGGYVPQFKYVAGAEPVNESMPQKPLPRAPWPKRLRLAGLAALLLALMAFVIPRFRQSPLDAFWQPVYTHGNPVLICLPAPVRCGLPRARNWRSCSKRLPRRPLHQRSPCSRLARPNSTFRTTSSVSGRPSAQSESLANSRKEAKRCSCESTRTCRLPTSGAIPLFSSAVRSRLSGLLR